MSDRSCGARDPGCSVNRSLAVPCERIHSDAPEIVGGFALGFGFGGWTTAGGVPPSPA